jgi:hypothetical protein
VILLQGPTGRILDPSGRLQIRELSRPWKVRIKTLWRDIITIDRVNSEAQSEHYVLKINSPGDRDDLESLRGAVLPF